MDNILSNGTLPANCNYYDVVATHSDQCLDIVYSQVSDIQSVSVLYTVNGHTWPQQTDKQLKN